MDTQRINYDESVIQEFAAGLYRKAASVVYRDTCLGLFGGFVAATIGTKFSPIQDASVNDQIWIVILIGAFVGALLGYSSGRAHSFKLKLEAQNALCQAQIERNTRTEPRAEAGMPNDVFVRP